MSLMRSPPSELYRIFRPGVNGKLVIEELETKQ